MSRAIIVGFSGQDGTILAQKLKLSGYDVLGISKHKSYSTISEFNELESNILDKKYVFDIVKRYQANQIYYLAAYQHSSSQIIDQKQTSILKNSLDVNLIALQYFLEAVLQFSKKTRVFYAASSHIYGDTKEIVQNEETPFSPVDYYGITKVAGIELCRYYREKKFLSIAIGIMYNHESIYRKEGFVSLHIIKGALDILYKEKKELLIGDLDAKVDWGSSYDYVDAMCLLLENKTNSDFIIGTGVQHSVRDFVIIVFEFLGMNYLDYVKESSSFIKKGRNNLCGDSTKIQKETGWKPQVTFKKMIIDMVCYFKENIYES
jgi:GDPmannose 4,6-dehydratase